MAGGGADKDGRRATALSTCTKMGPSAQAATQVQHSYVLQFMMNQPACFQSSVASQMRLTVPGLSCHVIVQRLDSAVLHVAEVEPYLLQIG